MPDEERDEIARLGVRPLEVLQDEQDGCARSQMFETPEHRLEQAGLAGSIEFGGAGRLERPATDFRQERRHATPASSEQRWEPGRLDGSDQSAECLDEWRVGNASSAELETGAGEDEVDASARHVG